MIEEEAIWIGGRIPVNTSGGLLARGHPVGASGVAQLCEIYWQLRGQAGPRQVNDARIGLAHNAGGTINGQPAATCITILQI
jgi:acetyl-CoA acetyltransferase